MHFDSVSHQLPIADEFEPPEPQDRAARRLWGGLLVSFIVHAFILSLQFGIPGLDLPSLELPWKEKRKHVDGIQVQISLPAPAKQAAPAAPAVTVSELFKLPDPILPTPQSKPNGGIVIVPRVVSLPAVDESKARSSKTKPIARQKSVASAPPVQKKVLPPPEAPVRVITQDQVKNEDFVVPVTSPEELERQREDKKEQKRQAEPIPADALIDKDAEAQLQEEKKRAELAAKKAEEEQASKTKTEASGLQDLLSKKIGNANVHEAADYAGSDNKDARSDKLVNKNDLKALLSSPDVDPALAKEIRENIVDKMDSADFKKKYMSGDYLDLEKIKKATGVQDAVEAEDQKWKDIAELGKETKQREESDAKARQIALEREQAVQLATELVRNDGSGSLHARADFVGSSDAKNRTDKLVGKNDLEALVADPSLSEEKRKFIQDNFLGDKWNSPAVKRMRQGDYISPESLKALLPNS